MIELKGITKTYKYKGKEINALDRVDVHIDKGEMVAITGESGAGKTTLLNIIGGMIIETSGEYIFDNEIVKGDETYMAKFRSENMGFILQNFALINNRNIFYNIALPLKYRDIKKDEIKKEVAEISVKFGIDDKLKMYPYMLSGGECQRAAIARAIISKPKVILADEPTSSLDDRNKKDVMDMLKSLNDSGITVLIATHDKEVANYCNRKIVLKKGMQVFNA